MSPPLPAPIEEVSSVVRRLISARSSGGNDLHLHRVGARVLQRLDLPVDPQRLVESLADGPQPPGPRAPSRHQTRVPLDGHPRLGRRGDEARAPLAHDRVGPDRHGFVAEAHRLVRRGGREQRHREGHERVGRGPPDCRRGFGVVGIEPHLHGVDARFLGRDRLFRREGKGLHEHPLSLLVPQVLHGVVAGAVGAAEGHDPLQSALGRISRRDASVTGRVARHGASPCRGIVHRDSTKVAGPRQSCPAALGRVVHMVESDQSKQPSPPSTPRSSGRRWRRACRSLQSHDENLQRCATLIFARLQAGAPAIPH